MNLLKITLKLLATLTLILFWGLSSIDPTSAQEGGQPEQGTFVYIVQPGDTLVTIAWRYHLSPVNVALANNLSNFNLIFSGQQLILPGVSAVRLPQANLAPVGPDQSHIVQPGETLYKIAAAYGVSMDAIISTNHLTNPDLLQTGQALQIPTGLPSTPEMLPAPFAAVELSEPTIIQGRTLIVKVKLTAAAGLSGDFEGHPLFFVDSGNGQFWSIVAIHSLTEPQIYPINLTANLPDGSPITFVKNVNVVAGPYGLEDIELNDQTSELLDPSLVENEQAKLNSLWAQVSPQPRWSGQFWYPLAGDSLRITSNYGTRRSYNNNSSEIASFHSGTDFGGDAGTPIYAPAAGRVVLAEKLAVRGNAVLIDHGLGLFSGYWHQSQIAVVVGQEVKPGDLIGFIGGTGLATGPHLHWEIRLNGIAVQPLQWAQQIIP